MRPKRIVTKGTAKVETVGIDFVHQIYPAKYGSCAPVAGSYVWMFDVRLWHQ